MYKNHYSMCSANERIQKGVFMSTQLLSKKVFHSKVKGKDVTKSENGLVILLVQVVHYYLMQFLQPI